MIDTITDSELGDLLERHGFVSRYASDDRRQALKRAAAAVRRFPLTGVPFECGLPYAEDGGTDLPLGLTDRGGQEPEGEAGESGVLIGGAEGHERR